MGVSQLLGHVPGLLPPKSTLSNNTDLGLYLLQKALSIKRRWLRRLTV